MVRLTGQLLYDRVRDVAQRVDNYAMYEWDDAQKSGWVELARWLNDQFENERVRWVLAGH